MAISCAPGFALTEISGADPRMTSSFNLIGKVDQISFLGRGGKRVVNVENEDLPQTHDVHPDIVALIIGENDVGVDTDPEGVAGRIMSLATLLCNRGYTQHVVICQLYHVSVPNGAFCRGCTASNRQSSQSDT